MTTAGLIVTGVLLCLVNSCLSPESGSLLSDLPRTMRYNRGGAKALSSKTSLGGQFRHFQRKSVYLTFFWPLRDRKMCF